MPFRADDAAAPVPDPFVPRDASIDDGGARFDASMTSDDASVLPAPVSAPVSAP